MWNQEAEKELLEILRDLIRIDTTNPPGQEIAVAEYLGKRLDHEGIEWHTVAKDPNRPNFFARLKGGDKEPLLFISHVDVVAAGPGWTKPAFEGLLEGETLYGRGTLDTKHLTAMGLMAMLLLHREGKPLNRDIIFAATADEECGSGNGMGYVAANHPQELPKGYVFNEGGGFVIQVGGKKLRTIACGEKGNCRVTIPLYGKGTQRMELAAKVMERLSGYRSPVVENAVTKAFVEAVGTAPYSDPTVQNLWDYSAHHCMTISSFDLSSEDEQQELQVIFKFLPQMNREEIEALFHSLLDEFDLGWHITSFEEGYECSMDNEFTQLLVQNSALLDPGSELLPMYALGNTDGRFLRHNVFGYTPLLEDIPFCDVLKMVHQDDEHITLPSLFYGGRVLYETARALALE